MPINASATKVAFIIISAPLRLRSRRRAVSGRRHSGPGDRSDGLLIPAIFDDLKSERVVPPPFILHRFARVAEPDVASPMLFDTLALIGSDCYEAHGRGSRAIRIVHPAVRQEVDALDGDPNSAVGAVEPHRVLRVRCRIFGL